MGPRREPGRIYPPHRVASILLCDDSDVSDRRLRALCLFALLGALAGAPTAGATSLALVLFRTPSGNIGCLYSSASGGVPASLRCDIRSRLHSPPPRHPAGCNLDWGDSLALERTGRAVLVCHGDTVIDPRSRVLAYGTGWARDGFSCSSQTTGLRCTNSAGHGFFLSRERWQRF